MSRLDYDGLRDDVAQVLNTLEPLERRVSRRDGTAHYLLRILPYRTPDSTVDGSLVTFVDVTRIVQAEQHQRLLVDELNHRVKNMLAVVISLATQTLRRAGTLEEFSGVFLGRVHALTAAYALLSRENWSSVQLQEIVAEELRPFMAGDRANVRIEGPAVPLDPRGALALGMAIHELATNAAKYGALSVPEGDVAVTWSVEQSGDGEHLVLDWAEHNGPPVTSPGKRGFGTVLIERGLAHDLSGEAKVQFLPDGVRARVRAPLRNGADSLHSSANTPVVRHPSLPASACWLSKTRCWWRCWSRTCCADAGCIIIGPFARVAEALAAARDRDGRRRVAGRERRGREGFPGRARAGGAGHAVPVRDGLRPGGPAAGPPNMESLHQAVPP